MVTLGRLTCAGAVASFTRRYHSLLWVALFLTVASCTAHARHGASTEAPWGCLFVKPTFLRCADRPGDGITFDSDVTHLELKNVTEVRLDLKFVRHLQWTWSGELIQKVSQLKALYWFLDRSETFERHLSEPRRIENNRSEL